MATVGDVFRVNAKGLNDLAESWNMVFHYLVTLGTDSDYGAILSDIHDDIALAFSGAEVNISDKIDSSEVDLFEWDFADNEWDGKAGQASTILDGAEASQALPNGNAMVLRFLTEELRRQGRKFVPGITEIDCDKNTVSASMITSLVGVVAGLLPPFTAGGLTVHPCTFNDTPTSPRFETTSKFILTGFVNSFVGYQRRRQPGAGA